MNTFISTIMDKLCQTELGLRIFLRAANSLNWHLAKAQSDIICKISPDLKITDGPFKGMIYHNTPALTSVSVAKFTGSYEKELHPILEICFKYDYSTVINIGCGEGYYAVGSALRLPKAQIFAFDLSLDLGEQCKSTAKANGVEHRFHVFGACTPNSLQIIPDTGRSIILCDCEGAEFDILLPENIPFFKYDILVETHDTPPSLKIITALQERFSKSHKIVSIVDKDRDISAFPVLTNLTSGERWLALTEFRPFHMTWLWLEAK